MAERFPLAYTSNSTEALNGHGQNVFYLYHEPGINVRKAFLLRLQRINMSNYLFCIYCARNVLQSRGRKVGARIGFSFSLKRNKWVANK